MSGCHTPREPGHHPNLPESGTTKRKYHHHNTYGMVEKRRCNEGVNDVNVRRREQATNDRDEENHQNMDEPEVRRRQQDVFGVEEWRRVRSTIGTGEPIQRGDWNKRSSEVTQNRNGNTSEHNLNVPLFPHQETMSSEIKTNRVTLPVKPSYHCQRKQDEFKYGADKIKTIPLPKISLADGDESDSEGESYDSKQRKLRESEKFARYYKSSDVYKKYDFVSRRVAAEGFGVHERKCDILRSIRDGRVTIVEGFTGCGKTTQVPQYILDECFQEKKACHIVVTQPRRISAVSVAKRVCYERNWHLPSVVGYQVGMENKTDEKDTLLTFMTTGVLLQKLVSRKSLKDFTHIIIDEVHERDLESDFLLLVIKRIMAADRTGREQHVKLILMSATMDTKKFQNYFVFERNGAEIRPGLVKIPPGNRHPVEELFLDHLLQDKPGLLKKIQNLKKNNPMIRGDIYEICVRCIISLDEKEQGAYADRRRGNDTNQMPGRRGAVLVFLPGMEEIKRMQRQLIMADKELGSSWESDTTSYCWVILPLHSSVTVEDQARVFHPVGANYRKIILSTNIAESSVTVSDICYVIDFCMTKSLCMDTLTNFTALKLGWAAKSQCVQRRGRTGRVAPGTVYRLITAELYSQLDAEITPEMHRSNLEMVVLMSKKFDLGSPMSLLKDALDAPKVPGTRRAVATLKELGALTIAMKDGAGNKSYSEDDGDVTFVGKVMTDLPISPQCTRLILLGHCFGVMREATIIAAGLGVKSPFQTNVHQQLEVYLEKMKHARNSFSDLFAIYYVYKCWDSTFAESGNNQTGPVTAKEREWAKAAMVHLPALREIKSSVMLLEERLNRLGINDTYVLEPADPNGYCLELSAEQGLFLKLAIAGAFYPQYFLKARSSLRPKEMEIQKKFSSYNPFRTVYFDGFRNSHNGKLYAKHVANYLKYGDSFPSVHFDGKQVFATFDNAAGDTIGPFNARMFRAIKEGQHKLLEFKVLPHKQEGWFERYYESHRGNDFTITPRQRSLPRLHWGKLDVRVQHINSPAQFWVVWGPDFKNVDALTALLDKPVDPIMLPPNKLCPNSFCLAPYENKYYRAKVLRSDNPTDRNAESLVYFVDYGNTKWVTNSTILDFSPVLMDKQVHIGVGNAIECRLKEVKPHSVHGFHWTPEAIQMMHRFCKGAPKLKFDIFSVHDGVVVGDLIGIGKSGTERSLVDLFLSQNEKGKYYGEFAPEPEASMENHHKREEVKLKGTKPTAEEILEWECVEKEQVVPAWNLDFMEPPTNGMLPVTLRGPRSPLEMNFQACVKCSKSKAVSVDSTSVNSVLLDPEPTVPKSGMLVAAHVTLAPHGACIIRNSTVMPPIPGFFSLVALLFSPKVEFRVDMQQGMYTGLVCGCGTVVNPAKNGMKVAVNPDNNVEIVFDTEIDDDDIDRINEIRSNINLILRESRVVNKAANHRIVRENLIKLLGRKRKKRDEKANGEEYAWDKISEDHLEINGCPNMTYEHYDLFRPHQKFVFNRK